MLTIHLDKPVSFKEQSFVSPLRLPNEYKQSLTDDCSLGYGVFIKHQCSFQGARVGGNQLFLKNHEY